MATIEEILAGTDTRFYDGRDQTFNPNNILQSGFARGSNQNYSGILGTDQAQNTLSATPILASELNAARNVGVPQDNRFTGIVKNLFARPLMFQGGVQAGLTGGKILTGGLSLPFALAGGIASQLLPLDRGKPDMDYQYVNDPNNMGGLRVVDNKIVDPSGILSGKNFESGFGSKNLEKCTIKKLVD